jgi:hypothetical protein
MDDTQLSRGTRQVTGRGGPLCARGELGKPVVQTWQPSQYTRETEMPIVLDVCDLPIFWHRHKISKRMFTN